MRDTKPDIVHALRELMESIRRKYGDGFTLELHGDGKVVLIGKDLLEHKDEHFTIEGIVNHAIDKVTKREKAEDIAKIYAEYPRKRDPQAARSAIMQAIRDPEIPVAGDDRVEYLRTATRLYARWCTINKKDMEWIPYPQTWYRRKSYLNDPKLVLELMQQLKSGVKPVLKTSQLPKSWDTPST